ncbi:hypothetical protein LCGC14_2004710, partial [marine sediment metagenome]
GMVSTTGEVSSWLFCGGMESILVERMVSFLGKGMESCCREGMESSWANSGALSKSTNMGRMYLHKHLLWMNAVGMLRKFQILNSKFQLFD